MPIELDCLRYDHAMADKRSGAIVSVSGSQLICLLQIGCRSEPGTGKSAGRIGTMVEMRTAAFRPLSRWSRGDEHADPVGDEPPKKS